jgi:hypothetical protein
VQGAKDLAVDLDRGHEIRSTMNDAMADRHQGVAGKVAIDPVEDVDEQCLSALVGRCPVSVDKQFAGIILDGQPWLGVVFVEQAAAHQYRFIVR